MEEAEERLEQVMLEEKAPELEFGSIYTGKIVSILDRGVMIQLHPALDPVLLPNNQLGNQRISHPSALDLTVGQDLQVKNATNWSEQKTIIIAALGQLLIFLNIDHR